jgi:hypothetical protein
VQPYSASFQAKMVQRMVGPRAKTASELSGEVGICQPTLSRWLRAAQRVSEMTKEDETRSVEKKVATKAWTVQEKLRVVVEAEGLAEDELGAFLRREGLHTTQLAEWRGAAVVGFDAAETKPPRAQSSRRVKELERELRRKDKELAAMRALADLEKKVRALWSSSSEADDTTDESET